MKNLLITAGAGILSAALSGQAIAVEIAGKIDFEVTVYSDEGQFADQDYRYNLSAAAAPEFYWQWNDGDDDLTFIPFVRGDQRDSERSHGDIRELTWTHISGPWEWRTGIRKVFWGVTEFNHLVDVINQTDAVDAFDGEEKLGQPMVNLSRVTDIGIFDAFVLPGFRERTFAGEDGRLRGGLLVDTDNATYESGDDEKHVDFALRWSHSLSVFDIGAYWFKGTDREPLLQFDPATNTLVPFYQQVTQYGLDLQATVDSWLWKLEALHRDSDRERFAAVQAGFEYTLYGIRESAADLGLLLEYGWDERGEGGNSVAQNDIYLGARLTLNDANDTAILMGASYDRDFSTRTFLVEASRRLNDNWTVALEALIFNASDTADPAAAIEEDDRLQLTLERYF